LGNNGFGGEFKGEEESKMARAQSRGGGASFLGVVKGEASTYPITENEKCPTWKKKEKGQRHDRDK